MRRLRPVLCALCLALLVPLLVRAGQVLPVDTRPLVAEKYAGWSGVLRLWVCEGWPVGAGSVSGWLNRCASRFEKRHPGVYVQPQSVDAEAIAGMNGSGILKPDMALFPPGLMDSPDGLAQLDPPDGLRPALRRCGGWGDALYAVPVLLGGYLWAWNPALTDGIPGTWADGDAAPTVPMPEAWRRWDAALLALCSGRYAPESGASSEDAGPELPGVDLGLGGSETPAPSPTPVPEGAAALPCRLPGGFQLDGEAWKRFTNGEAAAIPVTQREIRRLQALSEQGKGPDWRLSPGSAAFTDQLLCLAVVEKEEGERQALCREFLDLLLSEECQGELHAASAFAATDAPSGYGASDPLAQMDAALRAPGLSVPGCFDARWREDAEEIVRKFIDGSGEAPSLWASLRDRLAQTTNIFH